MTGTANAGRRHAAPGRKQTSGNAGWLGLRGPALHRPLDASLPGPVLPRGALMLDIRPEQGLSGPLSLLDPAGAVGAGPRITLDPARGVRIEDRQGLGGPGLWLGGPVEVDTVAGLRLIYSWDVAQACRRLLLETVDGAELGLAEDGCPLAWRPEDTAAIFAPGAPVRIDPSVEWLGLGTRPPGRNPCVAIGASAPVRVPGGTVCAAELRLGDMVETADHGPQPLRWVRHVSMPCAGSLTPIRLRAPYFGARADLIVAPNQRVRIAGPEVEYLFGEEEVLVQARRLAGSTYAVPATRRAMADFVTLGFERPEVFFACGCGLGSLPLAGAPPARRELHVYEAVTLLATRDRVRNPLAA